MLSVKSSGGGVLGGSITNAVLKEFRAADQDIQPNTFVEFASLVDMVSKGFALNYIYYNVAITPLNRSKAVVAYYDYDLHLCAMVAEVDKGAMTFGEPVTRILPGSGAPRMCSIAEDKIVIGAGGYFAVLTISGSNITCGTALYINGVTEVQNVDKIDQSNVVASCVSSGSRTPALQYGLCVNGTTLTQEFYTTHANGSNSGNGKQRAVRHNDRVYLFFSDGSTSYLSGYYYGIGEKPPEELYQSYILQRVGIMANPYDIVPTGSSDGIYRALFVYMINDDTNVYACVLTSGGRSMIAGTSCAIDTKKYDAVKIVDLGDGSFDVVGCVSRRICKTTLMISGTTVSVKTPVADISDTAPGTAKDISLFEGRLFMASTSTTAYAFTVDAETVIRPTAGSRIDGLTKTKCTAIKKGMVFTI